MLFDPRQEARRKRDVAKRIKIAKDGTNKADGQDVFIVSSGEAERRRRVRAVMRQTRPGLQHEIDAADAVAVSEFVDLDYVEPEEVREVSSADQRQRYFDQLEADREAVETMRRQMMNEDDE